MAPEGGGNAKAIEVYSAGEVRELTYEAMDEVLKADISEWEVAAIRQLLDNTDLTAGTSPVGLRTQLDCLTSCRRTNQSRFGAKRARTNSIFYSRFGLHWSV